MGPRTIRAKLTMTTMLVMGALLALLGLTVNFAATRSLLSGIDIDLLRRGDQAELAYARALDRRQSGESSSRPFRGPSSNPLRTLRPRFFRVDSKLPLPETDRPPYSPEALAQSKAAGRESFVTIEVEGQPVRVLTRPILESGEVAAVVQIPFDLDDTYRALDILRRILLILIPVGAVLTGLASLFLIQRLMRPLRLITQNAERVGANTLAERIPVVGQDEFAYLGSTLNGMLNRLQRAFETEQETTRQLEESLRRQRRFTADASHELKTPLAVIRANTDLVRTDPITEVQAEGLDAVDDAAERMNRLVKGLLLLAKAESGGGGSEEPCILAEVARRAARQTVPSAVRVSVEVEDESATVVAVFDDLVRVVQNLVDNAVHHSGGDEVRVTVRGAEIEVTDNGRGIASEHLPYLFDRFYRVDPSRNARTGGTGLGLAIARSLAEANGGKLDVRSEVGKGTTFTLKLWTPRPSGGEGQG